MVYFCETSQQIPTKTGIALGVFIQTVLVILKVQCLPIVLENIISNIACFTRLIFYSVTSEDLSFEGRNIIQE